MTKEPNVSLREHIESRLSSLEKATEVAKREMDRRLDGMNEFREQLRKQEGTFITKEFFDSKHDSIQIQVDELRLARAAVDAKASQTSVYIAYALAVISLLLEAARWLK